MKVGGEQTGGTGFFIAPGQVLTCAHVVQEEHAPGARVDVSWQDQHFSASILAFHPDPHQDIALLSLDMMDHPCVWLDATVDIEDPLWCYGYPNDYRGPSSGDSASFVYEGDTHHEGKRLLKSKGGQARPGMSGAPLLNRRTGGVCGVIKSTRNRDTDLGARAVPTSTILETFTELDSLQEIFHQQDETWSLLRVQSQGAPSIQPAAQSNNQQFAPLIDSGPVPTKASPTRLSQVQVKTVRRGPPARVRSFTGRRTELDQVGALLRVAAGAEPTILVIHGLSGVGKTLLCREYMDSHMADYGLIRWISADDQTVMTANLAQISIDLRLPRADRHDLVASSMEALRWFEQHDDWLLIFDNASPNTIGSSLPSRGSGDILVSSTNPNWSSYTTDELRLRGLTVDDAVQFLERRTGSNDSTAAARIAEKLDGLPLALEQAASFVQKSRIELHEYEQLLEEHRPEALDERSTFTEYPDSVYSALSVNVQRAAETFPHTTAVLAFVAFLSPNDVPRNLLKDAIENYYAQVEESFNDFVFNRLISELAGASLIVADSTAISIHPLVQAFTLDTMEEDHRAGWLGFVLSVLAYAFPEDVDDSSTWPICETLINHVISAIELAEFQTWDDESIGALYTNAGSYLHARGKDKLAIRLLVKALEQAISDFGPDHPQVALGFNNLLNALGEIGRNDEALQYGQRAIEILTQDEATREEYTNALGKVYSNTGRVFLHHKRNYTTARTYFGHALAIHIGVHGIEHVTTAIDANNIGTVDREEAIWASKCGSWHKARSKWKRAYDHFHQAVTIHRAVLSSSDYRLAIALYNLGQAANNLERFDEAEGYLHEAVRINDILKDGSKGSDQIDALVGLGHTLQALGKHREAITHFERAKEIAERYFGPESPEVQSIVSDRGSAAFALGKPILCQYEPRDGKAPN